MKKEKEITPYQPEWLGWEDIKKKYAEKFLLLGCKNKGLLSETQLEVLYDDSSNEKVRDFWLKNIDNFRDRNVYEGYAFRYIAVKKIDTSPKKIITSVRKIK